MSHVLTAGARVPSRGALVSAFRREVYRQNGFVPFLHQAAWQVAGEGWLLSDEWPDRGEPSIDLLVRQTDLQEGAKIARAASGHPDVRTVNGIRIARVRRRVFPRPFGVAHNLINLAAYKGGKSFAAGLWATGFACLPDALVQFVGLEYGTSEPEYTYLVEALCSERGMNMPYVSYTNDKRGGRMRLQLKTGAEFEVKSWNQKENLKGAKIDAYIYTEAYQLPGLEVYNSVSQNLRQRAMEGTGFTCWTTTPDRPWVGVLHDLGHGRDADWQCVCGVGAEQNPFTFDQRARDRDDPEKNGIMTKARFEIAWNGRLGTFIGHVYDYQRGQRLFTRETHPQLWQEEGSIS